jgi:hypothetical protein
MTSRRAWKLAVRNRMAHTKEPYTLAAARLLALKQSILTRIPGPHERTERQRSAERHTTADQPPGCPTSTG